MLTVSVAIHNPDIVFFEAMLRSLKKYTPELRQLIIIDNASDPVNRKKNLECISRHFKTETGLAGDIFKVNCIYNSTNLGFGAAHNQAIQHATQPFFAVLNDDIEFYTNWSTPMIQELRRDLYTAQVCIKEGQCNSISPEGFGYYENRDDPEYAEGSCFMMDTSLAKTYGPFDPVYKFAYFEDTDLSLRLRRKGFKVRSVPVGWVHHRAMTTSAVSSSIDIQGYHAMNEITFKSRWNAYIYKKLFGPTIVLKRTAAHGDVFLTLPVFEALREKHPDALLVLQTNCPEVVMNNPVLDVITPVGLPFRCSYFFDLDYAYEKDFSMHIVDAYAEVVGVPVRKRYSNLSVAKDALAFADQVAPSVPFVVIELSDTWPAKQWPLDNYKKVAEKGVKKEIQENETQLDKLKNEILALSRVHEDFEEDLRKLDEKIDSTEKRIDAQGGSYFSRKEELRSNKSEAERNLEITKEKIKVLVSDLLPVAIASSRAVKLKEQIVLEDTIQSEQASMKYMKSKLETLAKPKNFSSVIGSLDGIDIKNKADLKKSMMNSLKEHLLAKEPKAASIIHGLSVIQTSQILDKINRAVNNVPEEIKDLSLKLENQFRECQDAQTSLDAVPDESTVKPLYEKLSELKIEYGELTNKLKQTAEQLHSLNYKKIEIERKLDLLNDKTKGRSEEHTSELQSH